MHMWDQAQSKRGKHAGAIDQRQNRHRDRLDRVLSHFGTDAKRTSFRRSAAMIVENFAGRPKLSARIVIRGNSTGPSSAKLARYSFVVVHYVSIPAYKDDVPYVVAHVTLDDTDDQITMISNVIDCPWQEVRVGMPVRVVFDDVTPEVTLPNFRPI